MSATLPAPSVALPSYLDEGHTIRSWLLTTDHKRIAILYLVSVTLFFFAGSVAVGLVRLELLTPASDLLTHDMYNRAFTLHGVIMVWFFLVPSIPTVFGNFFIPMMVGARDMAFPRVNLASWYLFIIGGLITLWAILIGGVDTGWTFYTPYSSNYAQSPVSLLLLGVFLSGFSSIFTGINIIATVHTLRAPGMTWMRMPLFVWALYATSIILVLATPVLAIALLMIMVERFWTIGVFSPSLGGDPLLYQHLFWFYSHPVVYVMLLPAMGYISEAITCFARKRVFGYTFIAFSSLAIAVIGFLVWGHHMFVSGQSRVASLVFSLLSFLVALPSAVKVFNWTATLHKGRIYFRTPMIYALGFIGLFVAGGLTGLMLAAVAIDLHVHDTYFIVAHFHYIMVGGAVMGYLGATHFWWPKMTGRMYYEPLGIFSALLMFIGFNLTFFPQFVLGYSGMVRRIAEYPPEFQVLNVLSTAGASILGVAYVLPLCYLLYSLRKPATVGPNPWNATGLEWTTASPPPKHNFEMTPIVDRRAYDYESMPETLNVGATT